MNRSSYPRRYDLDALRAAAMLLGIALHAGFLLGLVTIVPAVNWISGWATASGLEANAAKAEKDNWPFAIGRFLQG